MGLFLHILLGILAVVGGIIIWIIRLGSLARSSREIGDAAGDIMGAARRARIRRKATASPLTTLSDPRDAAVALMVAVTKTEGDLTQTQAKFIERQAVELLGYADGAEALAHGRWLCQEAVEPGHVVQRVVPLISKACDEEQKRDIVRLMTEVASLDSEPARIQLQAIQKLAYDLGVRKTS